MKLPGFRQHGTWAVLRYADQMLSLLFKPNAISSGMLDSPARLGPVRMAPVWAVALVVSAVTLLATVPAIAQGFNPSCVETLRADPNAFAKTYVQKTQDSSELGYDMAALYWAKCKAASNNKRLERAPQIKNSIVRIRDLEGKLVNAEADLASQRSGNSAVYSHARARAQARLESHIGRLIAIAISPTAAIASRSVVREHRMALEQFDARLKKLKMPSSDLAKSVNRSKWAGSVKSYAGIWSSLRPLIGKADVFSLEVARFVAKGFFL
jgi:hypothetical protein